MQQLFEADGGAAMCCIGLQSQSLPIKTWCDAPEVGTKSLFSGEGFHRKICHLGPRSATGSLQQSNKSPQDLQSNMKNLSSSSIWRTRGSNCIRTHLIVFERPLSSVNKNWWMRRRSYTWSVAFHLNFLSTYPFLCVDWIPETIRVGSA